MAAPAWLCARPIAHRGLHDRSRGVIENSRAAALAAIEKGFAIECDVQLSRDGEAVVFHDFTLDRLTAQRGPVRERTAADLAVTPLTGASEGIPTLEVFLATLAGRVPLICEIKSAFDGDLALTRRTVEALGGFDGPVALKSFDPLIVAALRALAPERPRGVVGETHYDDPEWAGLSQDQKRSMGELLHYPQTQPDFLSWFVGDLETAPPFLARHALGLPVMAWTVRTPEQRALAAGHADQMVFEGFVP
jgi:glycerophosphoryl diester phosphodiesterase